MAAKTKTSAKTHQDYLADLSDDKRAALQDLSNTIRSVLPNAEECISYQLAAFRHQGKLLVAMGATENHCAFYLMSSSVLGPYKDQLRGHDSSKGTIRFQPDTPLPAPLVQMLVKARMAENESLKKKPSS